MSSCSLKKKYSLLLNLVALLVRNYLFVYSTPKDISRVMSVNLVVMLPVWVRFNKKIRHRND